MQHTELVEAVKRLKEIRAKEAEARNLIHSERISDRFRGIDLLVALDSKEAEESSRIVELAVEAFGGEATRVTFVLMGPNGTDPYYSDIYGVFDNLKDALREAATLNEMNKKEGNDVASSWAQCFYVDARPINLVGFGYTSEGG